MYNRFPPSPSLIQPTLSPLHTFACARALRVEFQRFPCICQRILRVCVRRDKDEPGVLHIRREEGGLLAEIARSFIVAAAQGFARFDDQFTGLDEVSVHIISSSRRHFDRLSTSLGGDPSAGDGGGAYCYH